MEYVPNKLFQHLLNTVNLLLSYRLNYSAIYANVRPQAERGDSKAHT